MEYRMSRFKRKVCDFCGRPARYHFKTGKRKYCCENHINKCPAMRQKISERMKKNNPMHDPEIVKKVTETRRKKGNYGKRKNNKKEN